MGAHYCTVHSTIDTMVRTGIAVIAGSALVATTLAEALDAPFLQTALEVVSRASSWHSRLLSLPSDCSLVEPQEGPHIQRELTLVSGSFCWAASAISLGTLAPASLNWFWRLK